jgi:alpha/beta superfamily hydrolase
VTIALIGIDWRDGSRSSRRLRDGFDGPVDAGEGLPIDAKQILGFLRHQGAEVWGRLVIGSDFGSPVVQLAGS